MGSVKKSRKRRKRRKIRNNKKKTQCRVIANCTFSLNTGNTGHHRRKRFKGTVPFVSADCIIKQQSVDQKKPAENMPIKRQVKKRYKPNSSIAFVPTSCIIKPSPVNIKANIERTDIKKNLTPNIYGPYSKDRRMHKFTKSSGSFVPPSCIINQSHTVTANANEISKLITPPIINTTHIIYGPEANRKRRKKTAGVVKFISTGCIADIKDTSPDVAKHSACQPPTKQGLSPAITEPKGILKRNQKAFGDNNVIVPPSCIIEEAKFHSKKTVGTWQLKIPKAVLLEKPAEIVGPSPRIRRVKKQQTAAFVSESCIVKEKRFEVVKNKVEQNKENESSRSKINENRPSEPADEQTAVEALVMRAKEEEKNRLMSAKFNNIYLLAAVIIIAIVIAIFTFNG